MRKEKSFPIKISFEWKITNEGMIFKTDQLKKYPNQERALTIFQIEHSISSEKIKQLSISMHSLRSLKKKS
ncbi:hypothetical protein AOE56_01950 [Candidatus Riesia pediculicola]|nr:hypothetical protein AOE56_01950 [Candidatus Riesia pediculicola]